MCFVLYSPLLNEVVLPTVQCNNGHFLSVCKLYFGIDLVVAVLFGLESLPEMWNKPRGDLSEISPGLLNLILIYAGQELW